MIIMTNFIFMYYKCTADLWSLFFPGLLKFTKNDTYEQIQKDVYINNQGKEDDVNCEKWQEYFIPIDLAEIDISEIIEELEFVC